MITIGSLNFSYGRKPLFRDFALSLETERFTAFLGPNGSGKTTLLKLFLGLLKPERGSLRYGDRDMAGLTVNGRASLLAYVPQNMDGAYDFTVEETVLMGRYHRRAEWRRETREDYRAAGRAMDLMEIGAMKNRSILSLSGGEKQRVLIARALAQDTPVILLDEPTAFLDLRHQHSIMKLLRQITAEENKTVISVVHDLNLALNYTDRAVLLMEGELRGNGRPEEVLTPENIEAVYGVRTEILSRGERRFVAPLEI